MNNSPILILASGSPRRRNFLQRLGLSFTVQTADIDETPLAGEAPAALAYRLAEQKAQRVAWGEGRVASSEGQGAWTLHDSPHAPRPTPRLIIAADTVVALEGESLGKPGDAADAWQMLHRLRNRQHQVITAISLLATYNSQITRLNTTHVFMRNYSDAEIAAYIATGDPMDKAGAYAIQHPTFAPVERIEGCLSGVIGLPVGDLCEMLAHFGVSTPKVLAPICQQEGNFVCCRSVR